MATVKTILLNALPASGKSEVRKFLRSLKPEECKRDFMVGESVQLDDYPYVELYRHIDEQLNELGYGHFFYCLPDRSVKSLLDWNALIYLINEDYDDLVNGAKKPEVVSASRWLFERVDEARRKAGLKTFLSDLPARIMWALQDRMEADCRSFFEEKYRNIPASMEGKTVFIEFARGGPHGSTFPLKFPLGYGNTYAQLSDAILKDAAVLYIWVTPEMSRAKNIARGQENPGDPAANIGAKITLSLNHSVPEFVMYNEYGCDDMEYLLSISDKPNTVKIEAHGKTYYLPVARFDNRQDYTTFCRGEVAKWDPENVKKIREQLSKAFAGLIEQYKAIHQ